MVAEIAVRVYFSSVVIVTVGILLRWMIVRC